MGFKVLITDNALGDLKEIVEFVAQHNPQAVICLGEKLVAHAMSLQNLPERFPFHDQRRGIRKMTIPPYLIFACNQTASVINILHFWHGARRSPMFST